MAAEQNGSGFYGQNDGVPGGNIFVLDYENDTHARAALAAYASSATGENDELAQKIRDHLNSRERLEL